jgi:hypothetical protein
MDWLGWLASRHTWLVHLPAAAALMIPWPILAAQRGGRGIRPWWTTCRYLAWAGFIGSVLAVTSGYLAARHQGLLPRGDFLAPALPGMPYLFRIHEFGGFASLLLGAACLRSLYRNRQDHQGIGIPALLFGLLWGFSALATSYAGPFLMGRTQAPAYLLGSNALEAPAEPPK